MWSVLRVTLHTCLNHTSQYQKMHVFSSLWPDAVEGISSLHLGTGGALLQRVAIQERHRPWFQWFHAKWWSAPSEQVSCWQLWWLGQWKPQLCRWAGWPNASRSWWDGMPLGPEKTSWRRGRLPLTWPGQTTEKFSTEETSAQICVICDLIGVQWLFITISDGISWTTWQTKQHKLMYSMCNW